MIKKRFFFQLFVSYAFIIFLTTFFLIFVLTVTTKNFFELNIKNNLEEKLQLFVHTYAKELRSHNFHTLHSTLYTWAKKQIFV